MKLKLTHAFATLVAVIPTTASAGGFGVSETGSRYAGRGNAAVALTDAATSVFYNPANLTDLSGFNFELGVSFVAPSFEYVAKGSDEPVQTGSSLSTPPNIALSYTLEDLAGFMDLSFGVGFQTAYGSAFKWPDEWVGAEAVQEIKLQGFEISPVIGIRPHKMIAIGGGLRIMPVGLYQRRAVNFGDQFVGDVELAGKSTALGASAGLSVWPIDGLTISAAWRSAATVSAEGDANFTFPAPFDTSAVDRGLKGSLPLPQVFRFGLAYDIIPDSLNVSADLQYQLWSTYESLDVTFINPDGTESTTRDIKNSMNSIVLHVGGEYAVTDALEIRAGYVFDQKTQPEEVIGPTPPDSDRHVIAVGASYFFGDFGLHMHLADVIFAERETATNSLPGTWRGGHFGGSTVLIGSLGFSGQFGGPDEADATEGEKE